MEVKQSPGRSLILAVKSWRLRVLDSFKMHCGLCGIPLKPKDVKFLKLDNRLVFCRKCWENSVKQRYAEISRLSTATAMDVLGCLYGLIYHSDLLRTDEDFAAVGKYVVSTLKGYVDKLVEDGYDPDAIMNWWPISLFQRLTGLSVPSTWQNKTYVAAAISEIVNVCKNKSLILYMHGYKGVWESSFRDAPAASALRREPLRKVQPEELAELLRQAHH